MLRSYYYKIELPPDLIEPMSDDEVLNQAVMCIEEKQKVWRRPCNWYLQSVNRDTGWVAVKYQFISESILNV